MKQNFCFSLALALATVAATFTSHATIFSSDSFTNGSTLNSATPANATPTNTAYEIIANKAWLPNPPTMTAKDL